MKTPQSRFTSHVGEIEQIFIETCQVEIVLPAVNSAHRVRISAESSRKRGGKALYKIPLQGLCVFIFATSSTNHVSGLQRAPREQMGF